jgi:hypothetical protein
VHPYDRLCEHLLKIKATAPALEWLTGSHERKPRIIGDMTNVDSLRTVDEVIAHGATNVLVMGHASVITTYGSVDALLFELPADESRRELLFARENTLADELGMSGSLDERQKYVLLRWK